MRQLEQVDSVRRRLLPVACQAPLFRACEGTKIPSAFSPRHWGVNSRLTRRPEGIFCYQSGTGGDFPNESQSGVMVQS
jgi:hypothetical protein